MTNIERTKSFEEFKQLLLSNLYFLDKDDDTYAEDLKVIAPILFNNSVKVSYSYGKDWHGFADPGQILYRLSWEYEGKGTLREWYPDAFKR